MTAFTRETYYAALFAALGDVTFAPLLNTISRRAQVLTGMNPAELPALFMVVGKEDMKQRRGLPPVHILTADILLYAANPDRHTAADIALNGMVDTLEAALAPDPVTNVFTLGGAVSHCWLDGVIEKFSAPLGERAAAIATISMLVP